MNKVEDKVVDFKFTREKNQTIASIRNIYQKVIQDWLLQVFNIKDDISLVFEKLDCLVYNYKKELYEHNSSLDDNYISKMFPYSHNLQVRCYFNGNRNDIFSFLIYGQNNCCGASTTSKTDIAERFKNKKLGTILQYLKEDITLNKSMSLMTCTDIYSAKHDIDENGAVENLKPYLPNTKVLLNTGWKVSELFYNSNSKNVVALYTKKLDKNKLELNISMKISVKDEKFVEIKNVTVGADPELFLKSKDSGEFIPSFFVIKGDKNNPTPISDDGHNIQCDNVMVEYGIPPSKTAEDFVKHNMFVQDYLKDKVAEPNNLDLVIFPYAEFDENNLLDERSTHFGCQPDFNVWIGGKPNTVGRPSKTGRSAGKIVCQAA